MRVALRRGLVILGVGLVGAVALELVSALWWPAPPRDRAPLVRVEPHPTLGYRLEPGQRTFSYQAPVHTDAHGLRVVEAAPTSTGARTLLFAGGSETFGKGVRAEQTFVARTAAGLGPRWRAVNAGTPDWNLEQSVRFACAELEPSRASALVLTLYWDDLFFDTSTSSAAPAGRTERGEWFVRRWARTSGALEVLAPLYTRSRVLCAARNAAKRAYGRADGQPAVLWRDALRAGATAPGLDAAWDRAAETLGRLATCAQAASSDVWVLILPVEPTGGAFADRARTIASQAGFRVVDASAALLEGGAASFIPYDGRPSEEGHRRIAEALLPRLRAAYQQAP